LNTYGGRRGRGEEGACELLARSGNRATQIRFRVWLLLVLWDDSAAHYYFRESRKGRQYFRPSWFLRGYSSCLRILCGNGRRSRTINDAVEALASAYSFRVERSVCRGDCYGAWLRGVLQLRRHPLRCCSRRDDR